MHVLREIFRQKLTLQRSHRQVVKALGVSLGKVSGAVARAAEVGLDADAIARLSDAELEAALYPKAVAACARPVPDCAGLHIELRRPKRCRRRRVATSTNSSSSAPDAAR